MLGLIPLVGGVLASGLPLFNAGPSGSPEAAQTAATAPPAAALVVTAGAKPTLQAIPAAPQATTGPTPIGSNPAPAATRSASAPAASGAAAPTTVAAAAVPTNPTPQANGPFIAYRVQPGDTVRSIATTYGVAPNMITRASGLANPDRLQVGQVLTVPSQPGYLYRVQPGETLDQIAARTGVASDTIATVSRLTVATVRAGDVLLIPDQTAATSK